MNTQVNIKIINMFIYPMPPASGCGPSSGGCHCGPVKTFSNIDLRILSQEIKDSFKEKIEIEWIDYSSESSIQKAIENLNSALVDNENNLEINNQNFFTIITASNPIITINGKFYSANTLPEKNGLFEFIKSLI